VSKKPEFNGTFYRLPRQHHKQSRDRAGEAENVMNLLTVNAAPVVADIGTGSAYYTVRLAWRVGPSGHVYARPRRAG